MEGKKKFGVGKSRKVKWEERKMVKQNRNICEEKRNKM